MPRKSTDKVIEHRVTFGDYERAQLKSAVRAESLKDLGIALQGGGTVLLGIGATLAAFVFFRYKAPDLLGAAKDAVGNPIKDISAFAFGSYGQTGIFEDVVGGSMKQNVFRDRREAQALAERRGQLSSAITTFCTASSEKYDEQKCSDLNLNVKRQYFADLQAFNDSVEIRYSAANFDPATAQKAKNFIYRGLGDIDPFKRPGSTQQTFIGPRLPDGSSVSKN